MDAENRRDDVGGPRELSTLDGLIAVSVKEAIESTRGNKTQAAKILKINIKTLCGYLKRYDIKLPGV